MRERVALWGGDLVAAPRRGGGFEVTADLSFGSPVTTRVLIADDQALVGSGFSVIVDSADDLEVVGQAGDGLAALQLARDVAPDVILMDIRMPDMDGLEATRRLTADPTTEGIRIIILTTFDLDEYVYDALRAGASGFLLKDTLPPDLLAAIRVVADGDALLAVSRGMSNAEIAAELILSPATAKTHVSRLLTKLEARDRAHLVVIAYETRLAVPGVS